VAEIKYKEGRHVGLDFYDLLIEEMSPNLEVSRGGQIGKDSNEQ
jgi:hypothetical protein